jgi:hypothetical protein
MYERGNSSITRDQIVVFRDGNRRLFEDHINAMSTEQCQGFRACFEHELSPAAEDDHVWLASEKFLQIRWLNTRLMVGSGLSPVPLPSAPGPKLGIDMFAQSVDVEFTPSMAEDPRGTFGFMLHPMEASERPAGLRPHAAMSMRGTKGTSAPSVPYPGSIPTTPDRRAR